MIIKTKEEYQEALDEIKKLRNLKPYPSPGTKEFRRINILAIALFEYDMETEEIIANM